MYRILIVVVVLMLAVVPVTAQDRPRPISPLTNTTRALDTIINGGFETDSDWTENSLVFPGDIICNTICGDGGGTAGPRSGTGFVWFGGASFEASAFSQTLTLTPAAGTADILEFYVWNGTLRRGNDRYYAEFVGFTLFEIVEGDQPYASGYSRVLANLTGIGTNGALVFGATSMDGEISNFMLDDVSLYASVPDFVVNGGFEDGGGSISSWTLANKSNDVVACGGIAGCSLAFKGSPTENSKLSQSMALPGAAAGDLLLGSFWGAPVSGALLNAMLTVTYSNGTTGKVKLKANFNAKYDDLAVAPGSAEFKLYQLPPLTLTGTPTSAKLTLTHQSKKGAIFVYVDNVSVALLTSGPRLALPAAPGN